jgi:zinc/manganese transport system ATP-binding protein
MDVLATRGARSGARPLADVAIELDRVTLALGGHIVLEDVNAAIGRGEFVGVFGPNGAGKTTLLRAILGLLRPAAGAIRVFGAPPGRGNRAVGYLPQKGRSAAELRLCGRDFVASAWHGERWGVPFVDRAGRREVERTLAAVEAETLAERPLEELSGGEVQRLLLAHALLGDPELLLLDEPLVSLDPHFQETLIVLVRRVQQDRGITVLFTAHELNPLLGAMDRVLYLGQRRAALGSVDEVITSAVLSRLYGMPIEVVRVNGRLLVVSGHGPVEAEAHRHDA